MGGRGMRGLARESRRDGGGGGKATRSRIGRGLRDWEGRDAANVKIGSPLELFERRLVEETPYRPKWPAPSVNMKNCVSLSICPLSMPCSTPARLSLDQSSRLVQNTHVCVSVLVAL
jgi:hypothetical protein